MELKDLQAITAAIGNPDLLNALMDRQKAAEAAEASARDAQIEASKTLAEASKSHAALAEKSSAIEARHAELDAKSENIGQMVEAHNANEARFWEQQGLLQRQQQDKEAALNSRETALEARERKYLADATDLRDRETVVKALETKHKAAREHAQRFLQAIA